MVSTPLHTLSKIKGFKGDTITQSSNDSITFNNDTTVNINDYKNLVVTIQENNNGVNHPYTK